MPPLAVGSSGGNVSIYLAAAGRWTPQGIERVAESLSHKFFIEPWYPYLDTIVPANIGIAAGFFKGSLYKASDMSKRLFDSYFSPNDITEIEVWVGTVREDTGSICLFGNRCRNHSIIKGDHYDRRLFKSEPLQWLAGDVDKICKSSVASSSIPMVIEGQMIDGKKYVDGGCKFASPLTPLQDEIRAIARQQDHRIHLIYISGYNVEADTHMNHLRTIINHGHALGSHVVAAFVLHDRMAAIQIVKDISASCQNACRDDHHRVHFLDIESRAIDEVYRRLPQTESCMFELYPLNTDVLDYTSFDGGEVVAMMNKTDVEMAGHLWWSGRFDLFQDIPGCICKIFNV
jgi:hypothetical protein